MRLVLARHGRTTANAARILDSRPPGAPLDEEGRAQAEQLAERLADHPIRSVHASRAIRTQQTAAPVAAAHGLAVEVVDGVHEVSIGELEGRSDEAAFEIFYEVYHAWWRGELDAHLPGGESALDLRARFLPVVERLTADGDGDGDVVVVSHGAAIRMAAAALLGDTVETWYVPNTGLVVLRREQQGWALEAWDTGDPVPKDVTGGGAPV